MRGALILALCIVLGLAAFPAKAIDIAGSIIRLQGSATATGSSGFTRPLQEGSSVLVGDRIQTGTSGRLRLRMIDGALLTLGSNSRLTVETYDESESAGRAVLGLVEGVFQAATGAIARLGPDRFTVNTPAATLGVRGTEVWGELLGEQLAVVMLSGTAVIVSTSLGSVELLQPEIGIDVFPGAPLPEPQPWSAERLERAAAAVAFD